jgi:hypothetical protein
MRYVALVCHDPDCGWIVHAFGKPRKSCPMCGHSYMCKQCAMIYVEHDELHGIHRIEHEVWQTSEHKTN